MSNFDRLMSVAIDLNKANRNEQLRQLMPAPRYAYEYCTVQLDVGRGVGKSEYINFHADDNDLILVHHRDAVQWFKLNGHEHVMTWEEFKWGTVGKDLRGRFETVWVDEPVLTLGSYGNLVGVFDLTAPQADFTETTYILLGK